MDNTSGLGFWGGQRHFKQGSFIGGLNAFALPLEELEAGVEYEQGCEGYDGV